MRHATLAAFAFAAVAALVMPAAAFAQAPLAGPSPDQQLIADWQMLNTAIQHVAQDLSAKMQASAEAEKKIADLQKQIADLKTKTEPKPDDKTKK